MQLQQKLEEGEEEAEEDTSDSQLIKKLCHVAANGDKWYLKQILTNENINSQHMGWTPLMWASNSMGDKGCECVLLLLQAGADATMTCNFNKSAMHVAAEKNNTAVIQILHMHNDELINCLTKLGNTPIMLAAASNSTEAVKLLIDLGAELSIINNIGHDINDITRVYYSNHDILTLVCNASRSTTEWAAERRSKEAKLLCNLAYNGQLEQLKELANCDNVNVRHRQFTPLMRAAMAPDNRGLLCLRHLLKLGANPHQIDVFDNSAMHVAARFNNVDVMRVLAAHSLTLVNRQARDGGTPLMWAASANQVEAVKLLIRLGANTDIRDKRGMSAGLTAKQTGSVEAFSVICYKHLFAKLRLPESKFNPQQKKI